MVNISQETPEQVDARLRRIIKDCEIRIYDESYSFLECPLADFPQNFRADALAAVRDDSVWSQLVPCHDENEELFTIWRFHFADGVDNSGFVGWLGNHLKTLYGTGVFVVCGQNRGHGGIFDYWGCPAKLGPEITAEVRQLVNG